MITVAEYAIVAIVGFVLFRLTGNGGAGLLLILAYAVLKFAWNMAGVSVERERIEREDWEMAHPGQTFPTEPSIFTRDGARRAWRQYLALAGRADRNSGRSPGESGSVGSGKH